MEDNLLGLLGVIVGALIAAVAGLIGLRLSRRTEQEQWLRNQKLVAYSQVHEALNKFFYEGTYASVAGTTRRTQDELWSMVQDLHSCLTGLFLVAPLPVYEGAIEAQRALLAYSRMDDDISSAAIDAAYDLATNELNRFIGLVRADLGAS